MVVQAPSEVCSQAPNGQAIDVTPGDEVVPLEQIDDIVESGGFYEPVPGVLIQSTEKLVDRGTIKIGSYLTKRASHRVGIYLPSGQTEQSNPPVVLMTTALGTGVKGHNQIVAEEMMRAGAVVIVKGPPRYSGPTIRALTLAEDANEMFGLLDEVERSGVIGGIDKLLLYGESQAAMKALGGLAVAHGYGREVADALIVAACYWRRANLWKIHKQVDRLVGIGRGIGSFIAESSFEQKIKLRATFSLKDLHHHIIVVPVLTSGETGAFVPEIPTAQTFTNLAFAKDGNSSPRQAQADLKDRFPNVEARVLDDYGHVDGIMSPETAALRSIMILEAVHRKQAQVNL